MGTFNKGIFCLLVACAASTACSFYAQAQGDGVIVLNRDAQPVHIGRIGGTDPYPTTASANPSSSIRTTFDSIELSDGDFANVASGASIRANDLNQQSIQGLNVVTNRNGLPGLGAGHQGGSGNAISGTINRALSSGLAPLTRMGGGQ